MNHPTVFGAIIIEFVRPALNFFAIAVVCVPLRNVVIPNGTETQLTTFAIPIFIKKGA